MKPSGDLHRRHRKRRHRKALFIARRFASTRRREWLIPTLPPSVHMGKSATAFSALMAHVGNMD